MLNLLNNLFRQENIVFDKKNSILVVGAGISIPSGLPSGFSILKDLLKWSNLECLLTFYKKMGGKIIKPILGIVPDFIRYPRLEVLFFAIKTFFKKLKNYEAYRNMLKSLFSHGEPNYFHYLIANFLNQGGIVITSNFDLLIEKAYKKLFKTDVQKIAFPTSKEISVNQLKLENGLLIKYHGCISSIDKIGIDVENLELEGFNRRDRIILKEAFKDKKNIIFIGSSLSDSLDFFPFIKQLKQNFKIFFFDYDSSCSKSYKILKVNANELFKSSKLFSLYWFLNEKINYPVIVIKDKNNFIFKKFAEKYNFSLKAHQSSQVQYQFPFLDSFTKKILKFYILKTMGLLTLASEQDIRKLKKQFYNNPTLKTIVDEIVYYWENIRGNYKYNLSRRKGKCEYLDSLVELVFYSDINIIKRCIGYCIALVLSIICYNNWKRKKRNIKIFRSWFHFILRNFYIFPSLSKIIKIDRLIKFQKELALYKKDIYLYRFSLKEEVKYLIKKKKIKEAKKKWKEAFVLSIDTDYFIETSNLLRLLYKETKDAMLRDTAIYMPCLTNDVLNLKKIKNYIKVKNLFEKKSGNNLEGKIYI